MLIDKGRMERGAISDPQIHFQPNQSSTPTSATLGQIVSSPRDIANRPIWDVSTST